MKKSTLQTIIIVLAAFLFCFANSSCYRNGFGCRGNSRIMTRVVKADKPHKCRWALCPYKGVTLANYKQAISDYTGQSEGTEAHIIDCLHILHPTADYDQLAEMMEND